MTYRGHSVLQTLLRCHFSPEFTTGQRYIYTGCAAGRVVSKYSKNESIIRINKVFNISSETHEIFQGYFHAAAIKNTFLKLKIFLFSRSVRYASMSAVYHLFKIIISPLSVYVI